MYCNAGGVEGQEIEVPFVFFGEGEHGCGLIKTGLGLRMKENQNRGES